MRWLKFLLILLIIVLKTPGFAQESNAPYVYYFSGSVDGFVLERADGSDARLVGAGLMQNSYPAWAEWSPSGEWLAWYSAPHPGCGDREIVSTYLASADQTLNLGTFEAVQMTWLPHQDRLLVIGVIPLESERTAVQWKVIVPGSDESLVSGEIAGGTGFLPLLWLEEETIIPVIAGSDTIFYRLNIEHGSAEIVGNITEDILSISPDGSVAYISNELADALLVVENIFTGEVARFPISYQERIVIDWHGNQAVVFADETGWWLDLENQDWQLIYETLDEHPYYQYFPYLSWTPQTWGLGNTGIVTDGDRNLYQVSPEGVTPLHLQGIWQWMDEQRVAIYDSSTDTFTAYDLETGTATALVFPTRVSYLEQPPQFSPNGQYFAFVDDGAVVAEQETGIAHYFAPNPSSQGNLGGWVKWHPTEPWLISIEAEDAGCGQFYNTSLIGVDGGAYYLYSCSPDYDCAHWLPGHVDPSAFPVYERDRLIPVSVLEGQEWIKYLVWSEDRISAYDPKRGDDDIPYYAYRNSWNVITGEPINEAAPDIPYAETRPDPEISETEMGVILAQSPDGERVFSLTGGVYIAATQELITEIDYGTATGPFQFSPDKKYLVEVRYDGPLRLWDAENGTLMFEGNGLYASTVAFSPDSSLLAIAQSWNVYIYRVNDLK